MTTIDGRRSGPLPLVALLAVLSGCGSGSGEAAAAPPPADFTGVWRGTASSTSTASTARVSAELLLAITSSGTAVTGTLYEGDPQGPAVATLAGTAGDGALDYAATYQGHGPGYLDCAGTGSGGAALSAGPLLDVGFWRSTSCDAGAVVAGTATLAWQAPSIEWCSVGAITIPATVSGMACTLRLVHGVGAWNATVTALDPGGPGVHVPSLTTAETARGCADACSRELTFGIVPGKRGTWRYRASFTQGGAAYSSDLAVTVE